MKDDIIKIGESIFNKLKIANHYLSEWEQIMLQGNSDNGKLYNQYFFFLGFARRSYLYMSILTLCTILDGSEGGNLKTLRTKIQCFCNCKLPNMETHFSNDKEELKRIREGLKILRDKVIAHTDLLNEEECFCKASISKEDISFFIERSLEYLKFLFSKIGYKKDFRLIDASKYGINLIYEKLVNDPEKACNDYLAIWEKGFEAGKSALQ